MSEAFQLAQGHAAKKQFLQTLLRTHFPSFVRKVFTTLNPATVYRPNWHIDALCYHLEQVRLGKTSRLITTMPPRSLKSICVSIAFPAFVLGHNPTLNIICASYAQSLSVKMQNDFRLILSSDWYRRIFPKTIVSSQKNSENEVLLTARGGRLATSVAGPLTGRGADFLIVDDPLSASDLPSDAARNAVNDWFGPVALSRLNDPKTGAAIVVAQRLHEDDLVGYLLRNDPENWTHLNLPAIADTETIIQTGPNTVFTRKAGSVLNPARDTLEYFGKLRRTIGEHRFEALYQQRPTPPGGTLFKRNSLRYFDQLPALEAGDRIFQSWDTASKTENHHDFSVGTTWHIKGGEYCLIDVYRGRPEFTELKRIAFDFATRYKADGVLVEDTGIGTSLINELKGMGVSAIGVMPKQSKTIRAEAVTPIFESFRVKFLRDAPWLNVLEFELLAFPGGRHDDQVDSVTQMLSYQIPSPLKIWSMRF